jgi:islet cell auto antigen 1
MLKSELQHQFWVTKKTLQRKIGRKEEECILNSDSELDAKIELFKSIYESCNVLFRIVDQYQERLSILSQEEMGLGRFLKEAGKNSSTSNKVMTGAGKSISFCGQQRMLLRSPLLRLYHEVETFRERAISDTANTINHMERNRTEYRAALSWMKSASAQLDPDTGKGLEKFRKAQNHVKVAKVKFDKLTLDCMEKVSSMGYSFLIVVTQWFLPFFTD